MKTHKKSIFCKYQSKFSLIGLSASESLSLMRQEREVKPNVGFLCQIGKLDDELRKERFRHQATSKCLNEESPKFFSFQYKKPMY